MRPNLLNWFVALILVGFGTSVLLAPALANRAVPQAGSPAQVSAVPISEEHHHHLVFDNPFIRAYEVEVPPHESTLLHRHDQDYVYVVFGDADITNAVEGKTPVKAHLANTTVNFAKGPFAHVARNDGDTTFRNITIQLLQPQGELKTYFPSVAAGLDAANNGTADKNIRLMKGATEVVLLETDAMRALAINLVPGAGWPAPDARHTFLVVWLNQWREHLQKADPNAEIFPIHMETWLSPGDQTSIRNYTATPMNVFVLEMKNGN
jgi:hypothetical protein